MMSNVHPRSQSPHSPRETKRPRLDATIRPPNIARQYPASETRESMREGEVHLPDFATSHRDKSSPRTSDPGDSALPSTHQQWPASHAALASDPNVPGPGGCHLQDGSHLTTTGMTSFPTPVATVLPIPSSGLHYPASNSSSLSSTPFVSSSPVASFSSDTSAATHHSSTTSVSGDFPEDVLVRSHLAQSSGAPGRPDFGLRLNFSDKDGPESIRQSSELRVDTDARVEGHPQTQDQEIHSHDNTPHQFTPEHFSSNTYGPSSHSDHKFPDSPYTFGPPLQQGVLQHDSQSSLHGFNLYAPSASRTAGNLPNPSYSFPPSPSTSPANPLANTLARDALLMYAHRIYDAPNSPLPSGLSPAPISQTTNDPASPDHAYTRQLIPLLTTLRALHPAHLPTLLLFGCALYAVGDLNGSLTLNSEILRIDPNYVEAMSNIGTTLKAMGKSQEAEAWWWKAIRLRPAYWDAMDNLLGVLCVQPKQTPPHDVPVQPRYADALHVCDYVESKVLNADGELLVDVPLAQRHRVQNLLYTSASIRYVMDLPDARSSAISHHFKALDFLMQPVVRDNEYEAVDVVIAVCVAGLLASAGPNTPLVDEIAMALGLPDSSRFSAGLLEPSFDILRTVHKAGPRLTNTLLRMGGGILPMTLLLPDQVSRLPALLFPSSAGVLPGLLPDSNSQTPLDTPHARRMTSTVLLTLAMIFQHVPKTTQATLPNKGSRVRASTSLVLLFYYLALAIHPSPATCNNMGIILSSVSVSTLTTDTLGRQEVVNGQVLANAYYRKGLSQDGAHPHLLTNLGSLLKDQGKIEEAINIYAKALQIKPDFDVALANMGNAIKDTGRPQESIGYYQRAVQINPDFHEAVCGLANARGAVCDWRGRGGTIAGEPNLDEEGLPNGSSKGWINKVVQICDEQLLSGYSYGVGVVQSHKTLKDWLEIVEAAFGRKFRHKQRQRWTKFFARFFTDFDREAKKVNEGGMVIRLLEFLIQVTQRRWYVKAYGMRTHVGSDDPRPSPIYQHLEVYALTEYHRPRIPPCLGSPPVPSVLPFHTFTYPLSSRTTRLMSYRNALRISYMTQNQSWLPAHVYPPPPPSFKIKVGYVSNDLNNHPLAHLMQSVFGFHDRGKFEIYVYATSKSDDSVYRRKIENESPNFLDVSEWSTREIVERIVIDGIHLLVNLGGYTKGARNDIFAARPSPVQLQFMGFAGTLAAGWCDYLVSDVISSPPDTCSWERWRRRLKKGEETSRMQDHFMELDLETDADNEADPESLSEDWMYTEHMIYMPHTFFVTDHKQSAERPTLTMKSSDEIWREEEGKRLSVRRKVFPDLPDDTVIFANFNQLYKIDPPIFAAWLRILANVPTSILWLLRFPASGEEHLIRTAKLWAGSEVAARVIFTDVASKEHHLGRARVADLFLDTVDCNAHTIAADVLWSGTPMITWPKNHTKMCSRVGASIANATGFGSQMVVGSLDEYEQRAIHYGKSVSYEWTIDAADSGSVQRRGKGELMELRRNLYLSRDNMPLFDTRRWTRNLEKGLTEAWRRWVAGTCYENSDEWEDCDGQEKETGSIWIIEEMS